MRSNKNLRCLRIQINPDSRRIIVNQVKLSASTPLHQRRSFMVRQCKTPL